MTENGMILLVSAVILVGLLIIGGMIFSFLQYYKKIRWAKKELRDSETYDEYHLARKELRCLYLRMIPFVNRKNVGRVYQRLFHRGRRRRKATRSN